MDITKLTAQRERRRTVGGAYKLRTNHVGVNQLTSSVGWQLTDRRPVLELLQILTDTELL